MNRPLEKELEIIRNAALKRVHEPALSTAYLTKEFIAIYNEWETQKVRLLSSGEL